MGGGGGGRAGRLGTHDFGTDFYCSFEPHVRLSLPFFPSFVILLRQSEGIVGSHC